MKNAVSIIYNMGPMEGYKRSSKQKQKENELNIGKSIFNINDIFIGDVKKALPDSNSA